MSHQNNMEMLNSDRINNTNQGDSGGGAELKLFGVRLNMPKVNTNPISNQRLMINDSLITNYGVVNEESLMQGNMNYSNSMRKSFSMGNLALHSSASGKWQYSHHHQMNPSAYNNNINSNNNSSSVQGSAGFMNINHKHGVDGGPGAAGINTTTNSAGAADSGYVSDGMVHASSRMRERKKGVPWSEDEHRLFLLGLQKLGKGDWRGISKNYVTSRTPTQVASHAQKYFLRQSNLNKRKRRSSLFDIITSSNSCPHLPQMNGSNNDQVPNNSDYQSQLHNINSASSHGTPMMMDVINLPNNPKFCTTSTDAIGESEAEANLSLSLKIRDPRVKTKAPSIFNLPMVDDIDMQDTRQIQANFTSESIPSSSPTSTMLSMPIPIAASVPMSMSMSMAIPMSMSQPTTRLSAVPLCRIDETVELSNLSLSIGLNSNPTNPTSPTTKETSNSTDNRLSLNLELQPAASAAMQPKHSSSCHSSPTAASATVNAMVAAAAAASSSQTNTTSYPNAISVV